MQLHQPIRRSLALVAVLSLAGVACGGDDDGGGGDSAAADTPIGKALTAELMSDAEDSPIASEEEASCMAGQIVSEIGEDRLTELGVTAENVGDIEDIDFTEAELGTVVDSLFDCVDVKAALAAEFEPEFGAEPAACLADKLDEDLIRDMMTMAFAGDDSEMPPEFFQAFLDIAAECDLPLGG